MERDKSDDQIKEVTPIRFFGRSLRWKVLAVLALVSLVTALLLGGLGVIAVRGLSGLARDRARAALEQELRQQLVSRVQEKARADDALFEGVRAQAVSLSRYVAWYYEHPENIPEPGYLKGGSVLMQTPLGHRVNRADTTVGVFVSRRANMTDAVWREVGVLSFADPLMKSVHDSTPGADRVWVISDTRIVRIYPNVKLGHEGSPVGPDYDLTEDEPFQAAAPARNPDRLPVWTAPHLDPVTDSLMITAAAPIYDDSGQFRAVAGVDMSLDKVLEGVLQTQPEPGRYAFLLDREGRVVGAPPEARTDLGLPRIQGQKPGRAVVTPLADATVSGVRELAEQLRGATAPGLSTFTGAGGRRYVALAPLPTTGWILGLVAPAEQVEGAALAVQASITRLEGLFLIGGGIGLLLSLGLVAGIAAWGSGALTRPVAELVNGTRHLAGDLSYRLPETGSDELGQLAGAFNSMAESIERSRDEAVRHARMVVEERNRLAREIHDTIAQGLTGIVVHLETTEELLGEQANPEALKHLNRARDLARESLQEARRSVWNLRPSAVAEAGLPQALRALAVSLRQDGIECTVEIDGNLSLSEAAEDALFRVCQEALANVRQHSGARHVWIKVTFEESIGSNSPAGGPVDGARAVLCAVMRIVDDGHGFDPSHLAGSQPGRGFGLWVMRGRLESVGGTLTVESRPGAGTTVTARVPSVR